ncbi:hypothetical protein [Nonomuraea rhodomycinica]|uniref:Uncharacterized protein n=1 Tax=Nonomuraea rhodomycinica TaxID=1712872 RepID=A0A7Y6IT42_9ACTN|nr:hypothetical protein [Nonomuraea rhodomycinica]NUW43916.1 hypothetical protein [Nonomuraea rhodomycinica]
MTEMVHRKQSRPVMQQGATVMDEIFPLAPEPWSPSWTREHKYAPSM